jgi:hypothetical protein
MIGIGQDKAIPVVDTLIVQVLYGMVVSDSGTHRLSVSHQPVAFDAAGLDPIRVFLDGKLKEHE